MIDAIQREYGLRRSVVQPVVIRWMVEKGKFKVQERSTHRKRLNRYYRERLVRALRDLNSGPFFVPTAGERRLISKVISVRVRWLMEVLASSLSSKIALRIPEAAYISGLSRSTLYALIGEGKLRSVKVGGRRLILRNDLEAYFAQLLQEQQG